MSENILVSVYCLAFNHEKYIRDCLEGFVNQKTNFRYEVIVHDDASTDNTADIIREYAERFPEIIKPILQVENQYSKGVPIVEKYIFPKCRGKYIAICEGDDYWCDVNKLQKQVDSLEANPDYVACVHQTKLYDCLSKKESLVSPYRKSCIVDVELALSAGGAAWQLSSLMYRSELIAKRAEFCFVSKSVGDYPLAMYLALTGPIYFISDVMSVYRMYTEGSWSLSNKKKPNIKHHEEMITILRMVDEYSEYKYHKMLDEKILEHEYHIWKQVKRFNILCNQRFKLLSLKKKIKLIFRIMLG